MTQNRKKSGDKYIRMALIMALLGITDPVTGRTVLDTHSL